MTDLDDRFESYVFAPKRERIVQKWRVIQCQFVTLFSGNGIVLWLRKRLRAKGHVTNNKAIFCSRRTPLGVVDTEATGFNTGEAV